jgi:AcrR family transcriptional regulator
LRAGTAAGTFYQHFPSKRELLLALMDELIGRLRLLPLRPEAGGDARSRLRRFLTAVFRVDRDYYGVVRAWQEAVLSDPGLAKIQKEIEAWTQARILGVFQLLRRRGGRDLPGFARMMDRHFWSLMARGSRIPPREIQLAADVIYFYLGER